MATTVQTEGSPFKGMSKAELEDVIALNEAQMVQFEASIHVAQSQAQVTKDRTLKTIAGLAKNVDLAKQALLTLDSTPAE